jgi:hypothetical protein
MIKVRLFSIAVIGVFACAAVVFASDPGRRSGVAVSGATAVTPVPAGAIVHRPHDFGPTGDAVSTFHTSAFKPVDTSFSYASNGFDIWPTSYGGSHTLFEANVQVPEGAVIDYMYLDVCNANGVTTDIVAGGSVDGGDFINFSLPDTQGCYSVSSPFIGYPVQENGTRVFDLFVNWNSAPIDGSLQIEGAKVWWHRTVSPAPANSDFLDVPTSDPRFQFIEAIYNAGVTAGCGGGNYCPDAPLTRGQMAVFIAKALGLYWPN